MIKNVLKTVFVLTVAIGLFCACGGYREIEGTWQTESSGVVMTVSFDNSSGMTTVCNVVDKAAATAAGINQDMVEAKNISCVYKVDTSPDISHLSEQEQRLLKGKYSLTSYSGKEAMKNNIGGDTIYFTLMGNKLITTQKTGEFDSITGVPVYSDTVFEKK